MLDFFLVLGQIPGTHITITFNEMLISALIFAGIVFWQYRSMRKPHETPRLTVWDTLINYDVPELQLPAQPARPSFLGQSVNAWLAWRARHWRITH